jgi:hypothetical protein
MRTAVLAVALFAAILAALFLYRPTTQANDVPRSTPPQFDWKLAAEREFTLTPIGDNASLAWRLSDLDENERLRIDVEAEHDISLTSDACRDRGAKFSTVCNVKNGVTRLLIADARPTDAVALGAAIISERARIQIAEPNRVHIVLYRWACISNCSPEN